MRKIKWSTGFKRDHKHIKAVPKYTDVDQLLSAIVALLSADEPLPESNRDHPLSGDWVGYWECHVKPDLLLIYRKSGEDVLRLARLGSHSELFR